MEIFAFILAIAAVVCFLLAAKAPQATSPNWHFGWLGLALLTIAWMIQLIVLTGSHLTVH